MKSLSRQSNVSLIRTVLILESVLQGCDVNFIPYFINRILFIHRTDLTRKDFCIHSNVSVIYAVLILESVLQWCDVDPILHKHIGCMLKLRIIMLI